MISDLIIRHRFCRGGCVTEVCCDMRLPRHCLSPKWLSKSYYLQHLAKLDPSRLEASKRDQVIDTLERRNKRALQNMLRWPNPTLYSCCGLTGSYRDHSRPCRHPVSIHLAQKTAAGHRTNNGNSQSTLSQRLVTPWRSHGALDSGCLSGLGQQGALRQNLSCQLMILPPPFHKRTLQHPAISTRPQLMEVPVPKKNK
jgi:hypothetical protein